MLPECPIVDEGPPTAIAACLVLDGSPLSIPMAAVHPKSVVTAQENLPFYVYAEGGRDDGDCRGQDTIPASAPQHHHPFTARLSTEIQSRREDRE